MSGIKVQFFIGDEPIIEKEKIEEDVQNSRFSKSLLYGYEVFDEKEDKTFIDILLKVDKVTLNYKDYKINERQFSLDLKELYIEVEPIKKYDKYESVNENKDFEDLKQEVEINLNKSVKTKEIMEAIIKKGIKCPMCKSETWERSGDIGGIGIYDENKGRCKSGVVRMTIKLMCNKCGYIGEFSMHELEK